MSFLPLDRLRRICVPFALQAGVWFMLSLAIAAMLAVGQPFEFANALRFSAANWMPWALVTPVVFWAAGRFPVGRGRFVRSLFAHLAIGVVCTVMVAWISLQLPVALGPVLRTGGEGGGRQRAFEPAGGVTSAAAIAAVLGGQVRVLNGPGGRLYTFGTGPDTLPPQLRGTPGSPGSPGGAANVFVSPDPFEPPPPAPTPVYGSGVPGPTPTFGPSAGSQVVVRHGGNLSSSGAIGGGQGFRVIGGGPGPAGPFGATSTWRMQLVPLALRANAGIAIYLVIASAAHALAFYRQIQERERQSLALVASRNQAKLDALRLQLQPHFLFNTLNAISTLVHRDPEAADTLIGDLSDLLRVSLQTTAHEVTLARELELLGHYLAIEQARLGSRLHIRREIDPAALGAYVPTLILQPLAENAIRHGLEPRLAPGTLTLCARREGDTLRLTVTDDGVGFDPLVARSARRGIGLANSEERLRTLHNDRARLDVVAPAAGGVRVDVTLPFRTAPTPALAAATAPA